MASSKDKPTSSIQETFMRLPDSTYCFSGEQSGEGVNLKLLLSFALNEFGLDPLTIQRLRTEGLVNLGKVASQPRDALESIIQNEDAMALIDWQLAETGLNYAMSFCSSVISEVEFSPGDITEYRARWLEQIKQKRRAEPQR